MRYFIFSILAGVIFTACATDIDQVNELTNVPDETVELARKVEILYSDSAHVEVRVQAPTLVRHIARQGTSDEFPEGIFIEFLDRRGNPNSWLRADYAKRDSEKNIFVTQGNVRFYNKNNDALESTELIWHEKEQYLDTDKFVRIVQPSRGDTSTGFGFRTNPEFTLFEIKRRTTARYNIERLTESLKKK